MISQVQGPNIPGSTVQCIFHQSPDKKGAKT